MASFSRSRNVTSLCMTLVVSFSLVAPASAEVSVEKMGGLSSASDIFKFSSEPQLGSVIALNRDLKIGARVLPKGSELVVGAEGVLSAVSVDSLGEATGDLIDTGLKIDDLTEAEYTLLEQNEESGEIEAFNIPDDLQVAGRSGGRRRRSGVTNCYHVVKQIVRRRISLTGVAAYMAAPQLRAAGWRRYDNYSSAPMGSVCVFAAGGIRTPSGGHIYGHVGVKGAGGVANPTSGFHLQRPFLGCWNES